MIAPPAPFHDSKSPAPAWARTVIERRLRWLVTRHPKMNSVKRHGWAVCEFQPAPEIKKR
jgi:hypothetical protein